MDVYRAVRLDSLSTDNLVGLEALLNDVRQITVSSCQETLTNALLVSNMILVRSILLLYHGAHWVNFE